MKFGEKVIRFYGLGKSREVRIYYLGLGMDRFENSYETEFDRLVAQMEEEHSKPFRVEKRGVTLSSEIAGQRGDIGSVVGDLNSSYFPGLLFVPRPYVWANGFHAVMRSQPLAVRRSDLTNELLAYLLRHSEVGVIAFDLGADFDTAHITNLLEFLTTNSGYMAERVKSPTWQSTEHILVKPSNN